MGEKINLSDLQMLSVQEAADLLRLSPAQIRTLLRAGQLPGIQFKVGTRAKWLIPAKQLREAIGNKQREWDSK